MLKNTMQAACLAVLCLGLAACSGGASNSRLDYKESDTPKGLAVPPDLTAPSDTGIAEIPIQGPDGEVLSGDVGVQVLPKAESIHIEHDGAERWLRIDTAAGDLWPKLREFWPTLGLELEVDQPLVGIMETAWAENRADAPSGFLSSMVRKVFKNAYSAGTRDKYRLRIEPLDDGSSELFITHYGLKEVIATQIEEVVETAWEVRPSDPELANEVMNRIILYLGGSKVTADAVLEKKKTEAPPRARLIGDSVIVDEGFSRTWRRTGIALDRLGLIVDDRNRSEGIYYISRIELMRETEAEGGWFSGLFSSEKKEEGPLKRQVRLQGGDTQTEIRVYDEAGQPDSSDVAGEILKRLQEALK